jgi:cobalt-zinc-cadmium efflux system membrane fusion protein
LLIVSIACCLASCKSAAKNNLVAEEATQEHDSSVKLSMGQRELAEIETGKIEKRVLSDVLEWTGFIEAPPQNLVTISAPMGGIIKTMEYFPGNFVQAGTVVASLENSAYISIQQEFLQTKNTLEYYKEEFRRQGELTLENAVSMKKMQLAQSDYKSLESKFYGLKKQLQFIGVDPEKLTNESMSSVIRLVAPISGYVVKAEGNVGKYVEPNQLLYEMVDKSHLHLKLMVFEKDISAVRVGQEVIFSLTGSPNQTYKARIETIGQMIDATDRSVVIHAHVVGNNAVFMPGMYVNANVVLNNLPVCSVPVTALVRQGAEVAIFIVNGSEFKRVPVKIGAEQGNFIEIVNPSPLLLQSQIVTKGAYYIESELLKKRGE